MEQNKKKELSAVEKLTQMAEKGDKEAKMELSKMLSVRQRLERRLAKRTTMVTFDDDLGEFNVEIRLMSPKEQNRLMKLYAQLNAFLGVETGQQTREQAQKLLEEGTALVEQVYQMAGFLCVDPELNAEYWKKGSGYNIDVPLKIIRTAAAESQKIEESIKKFRVDS